MINDDDDPEELPADGEDSVSGKDPEPGEGIEDDDDENETGYGFLVRSPRVENEDVQPDEAGDDQPCSSFGHHLTVDVDYSLDNQDGGCPEKTEPAETPWRYLNGDSSDGSGNLVKVFLRIF
ncbi:hypothetical protein QAD02_021749 [Eretmocerus hayati]|uniref:Uncharacterized protein n=1 Tax=Eretmocerus hayati TaxID=131215 RepID=A0ACC2PR27_9HYME|nr:hypothetical protein QAD02_021749 [Eretmocerus hayati]